MLENIICLMNTCRPRLLANTLFWNLPIGLYLKHSVFFKKLCLCQFPLWSVTVPEQKNRKFFLHCPTIHVLRNGNIQCFCCCSCCCFFHAGSNDSEMDNVLDLELHVGVSAYRFFGWDFKSESRIYMLCFDIKLTHSLIHSLALPKVKCCWCDYIKSNPRQTIGRGGAC